MEHLWIFFTLLAVALQAVRTALQKRICIALSVTTATLTRYIYGLPIAVLYYFVSADFQQSPTLNFTLSFYLYCLAGGCAQILATIFMIRLFLVRNFAVGIAYTHTAVLQTALFGLIIGDVVELWAVFAVIISFTGVIVLSMEQSHKNYLSLITRFREQGGTLGLLSGMMFAISATAIRGATMSLGGEGFIHQAAVTLAFMILIQTVLLTAYVTIMEPAQLQKLIENWQSGILIGLTSIVGSIFWFNAMALEKVAYVKALGQVDMVLACLISRRIFSERPTGLEITGMALTMFGVIFLLVQ